MLKGSRLDKFANNDLGFWAYRLDDAFPADMRNKLATLVNESFDPTKGGSDVKCLNFHYKELRMCKHPCLCADMYAGLLWRWGHGGSAANSTAPNELRPRPPAVVEDMVLIASKYLVEEVLKLKPRNVQEYQLKRLYEELSNFYVVANRCEEDTTVGDHSGSHSLCAVSPHTSSGHK
ncbi:MAG: hypothetical protein ACKPKO_32780, partial [Candidatus Fonsibacter sp.]